MVASRYSLKVVNTDGVYGVNDKPLEIRNSIPLIETVLPIEVNNRLPTTVTVSGQRFVPIPNVILGNNVLSEVIWLDEQHVAFVVPQLFPEGTYSLTIVNPGPGDPAATTINAFRITALEKVFLPSISN